MLFSKKTKPGEYEIRTEGKEEIMYFNFDKYSKIPSIEEDPFVMAKAIDSLVQVPSISSIIFNQKKNYEYGYSQTKMLQEISSIYNHFIKQRRILTFAAMGPDIAYQKDFASRQKSLQYVVLNLMRTDPIGAYVEVTRLIRNEKIKLSKAAEEKEIYSIKHYLNLLTEIFSLLNNTLLIKLSKEYLPGYEIGSRDIYKLLFKPMISPDFIYTKLMSDPPLDGEEIDSYSVDSQTRVMMFKTPRDIKPLYHLIPPEFQITEDKYALIDLARNVLSEHQPKADEFLDPERMRATFLNIGRDLLTELASHRRIKLSFEELEEMAEILVRYTVGFGLVETLLKDQKVQDIVINGPIGQTPIFIVHSDHEECVTNIIPSQEDGEGWASKLRLISARPLDEANPVLDTELIVPGARARVAAITRPLNPLGLGYSIRRHRDKPWSLPLFTQNRMITPLAAGLMSFLIDGARTLFIAGTRGSGKTSFLGSCLVEIMRKYRIITVEDSVAGDSEILIKRNNKWERITMGALIDNLIEKNGCWYNLTEHEILGNEENIEILAMDKKGKIIKSKISKFIRHKIKKPIYKIITRTGKEIKVTGDHSLFGLNKEGKISEVKVKELEKGSFIATPRNMYMAGKELKEINLLSYLDKFENAYIFGGNTKEFLKKYYYEIQQLGKEYHHNRSLRAKWFREGTIHIKILKDLRALGYNINEIRDAKIKVNHNSQGINIKLKITKEMLTFIGLWLADGCYDKNSTIISSITEEERSIIYSVANELGLPVKMHSDNVSLMINSSTFKTVLREILNLKGNAYTKRIPNFVFSLTNNEIKYILCGLFSGDGHVSKNEIMIALASKYMLKDIQTLLLRFGITHRIGKLRNDKTYNSSVSSNKSIKLFKQIGFLQNYKKENLSKLANKISTHDSSDIVPLSLETKKELKKVINNFNYNDYVIRNNNIGTNKLTQILEQTTAGSTLLENIKLLSKSDIFWDEIKEIEIIESYNDYVYDISVPECESFICNNIIAHNTLELPTDALRELGYNIQPMKVRSALVKSGAEVSADEGIRTSLRMGDSSLIVGEIRSLEAFALFEAMRVGALANTVAGTIHGDSPYGVFDRIVNDLQVPRTSFKATDIIVICNPIKSSDGLHKFKRVTQITEVRKEWEQDPLAEGGFVDLMKYDIKKDQLVPTDNLINGDSYVIKSIAGNVKEWAGNWDAVWDNIILRAKLKETMVNYAARLNSNDILEAKSVIAMNDSFHKISDEVREKHGYLDSKKIYLQWEQELKKHIKKTYG